jgi:hypothetical protein
MNDPPPRPELCGSTKPSTAWIATAASTALPPSRNTRRPASTASGLAAATMPLAGVELETGLGVGMPSGIDSA